MTELPTGFWSGWVLVLTVVGSAGLLWLVLDIYLGNRDEAGHAADAPSWDGDLAEGSNPAPLWWFWLILSMMVFSVVYLMLYPGLGSFEGAFHWSQQEQLHQHQALFDTENAQQRSDLLALPIASLQQDGMAMASARRLFRDNCAACHGAEANGLAGLFPNLRDGDWNWGGTAEQIEQTIRNGRIAVMVPWQPILGDAGVEAVSAYVKVIGTPAAEGHAGQMQFNQFCIACHGATGDGNALLGAPRLNDDIWLYGGDDASIRASIAGGRNGQMPAFAGRLDDLQVRLLVAWLLPPQG